MSGRIVVKVGGEGAGIVGSFPWETAEEKRRAVRDAENVIKMHKDSKCKAATYNYSVSEMASLTDQEWNTFIQKIQRAAGV